MEKRNSKNHMDNNEDSQDRESRLNAQEMEDERIEKQGQVLLNKNKEKHRIHLLSIIGEIEGHEAASPQTKTTKYEHVLPQLASIEDSDEIDGILVLLNTVGGDVEAGLAIGEMIASPDKAYSIPGPWGKPFYRCTFSCVNRLFIYCKDRDNADPSGTDERYDHWSAADI